MYFISYLGDPANWVGAQGITVLIIQHLWYTFLSVLVAAAIGLPAGFYVGHTRRGVAMIAGVANGLRALPSLGLIVLLVILFGPHFSAGLAFLLPSLTVLVLLAVPPILVQTYSGIAAVDARVLDAARGMGYKPLEILFRVEIPCALPLIISGFRTAALQVISTATIAAYVSLGGLGRLIIDGRAQNDYSQMAAGAVLIGTLAILVDLIIGLTARFSISPGLLHRRGVK